MTQRECLICMENISDEDIVLYNYEENDIWYVSNYCKKCVIQLRDKQWSAYINGLKDDCKKSVKKLIDMGPPINIRDDHGFPEKKYTEIYQLFFDNSIQTAKLTESLTGEDRIKMIDNLLEMLHLLDLSE